MVDGEAETTTQHDAIICSHCKTCIFRHYAASMGRCWNCRFALADEKSPQAGREYRW